MSSGQYSGLINSFQGSAACTEFRFVKLTSTAKEKLECADAGAGDQVLGVCAEPGGAGDNISVAQSGIGMMALDGSGTAIVAKDRLQSDAAGKGVKSAPAAGVNAEIGAISLVSTSADELGWVHITPMVIFQGAA